MLHLYIIRICFPLCVFFFSVVLQNLRLCHLNHNRKGICVGSSMQICRPARSSSFTLSADGEPSIFFDDEFDSFLPEHSVPLDAVDVKDLPLDSTLSRLTQPHKECYNPFSHRSLDTSVLGEWRVWRLGGFEAKRTVPLWCKAGDVGLGLACEGRFARPAGPNKDRTHWIRVLESLRNATCSASLAEPWSPGEWLDCTFSGGRTARRYKTPLHQSLQPLQTYLDHTFRRAQEVWLSNTFVFPPERECVSLPISCVVVLSVFFVGDAFVPLHCFCFCFCSGKSFVGLFHRHVCSTHSRCLQFGACQCGNFRGDFCCVAYECMAQFDSFSSCAVFD